MTFEDSRRKLYAFARCLILIGAIMGISKPADAQFAFRLTEKLYLSQLKRLCPEKHLELLSPSDEWQNTDVFRDQISKVARARVNRLAHIGSEGFPSPCRNANGANCEFWYSLRGIRQAGLLRPFVHRVCISYKSCSGQSDCEIDTLSRASLRFGEPISPRPMPDLPPLPPSAR